MKLYPIIALCLLLSSNSWATEGFNLSGYDPSGGTPREANVIKTASQRVAKQYHGELFHQAGDPIVGNRKGKVSLAVFFDFQCAHCIHIDSTLTALRRSNPNLRLVYKEYPIRGAISLYAAKAALAANKQGKYQIFHQALIHSAKNLNETKILELAKTSGLDLNELKTDMNSNLVENIINENRQLGRTLGLQGTPALFVARTSGGDVEFIMGAVGRSVIQAALDKMR